MQAIKLIAAMLKPILHLAGAFIAGMFITILAIKALLYFFPQTIVTIILAVWAGLAVFSILDTEKNKR